MKNFLGYFYILSKLSTSLVLFSTLIFLGYLFYNSYSSINSSNLINEDKLSNVLDLVESNQKEISNLAYDLNNKLQAIEDIKNSLEDPKLIKSNDTHIKVENLNIEISKLKNTIIDLENSIKVLKDKNLSNTKSIVTKSNLVDIKKIIFVKFLNNENIEDELDIFNKIVDKNYTNYIEKIIILKQNTYFSYEQILKEFDIISQKYLKQSLLKDDTNYLINFLSPILKVEPSKKGSYSNEELRSLKNAEEYLINKNFENCLEEINKLKFSDSFFNNFKSKLQIYTDLQKTLVLIK